MGAEQLTVAEVAELQGCSQQYIRLLIGKGQIYSEKRLDQYNHFVHYIPLSTLDPTLQRRYRRAQKTGQLPEPPPPIVPQPLEVYTSREREQIAFWERLIQDWLSRRSTQNNLGELDRQFVTYATLRYAGEYQALFGRPFALSPATLYRRLNAQRMQNYDGMIEKRGRHRRGESSIPDLVWQGFLSYYLDQSQFPIRECLRFTTLWLEEKHPELLEGLPSYSAFYRRLENEVSELVKVYAREGEKALDDRSPYIRRVYDNMASNDYWIADTHTLDIMSKNGNGSPHRLYLVAFFDARSGIFTGCTVTDSPSSQAVLTALRKGILRYGIPNYIYVDNGREFLTHDVGGKGHRQRKSQEGEFEPLTVFQRLGITMINAKVKNAKAKTIERRFRDIKDQLSRLYESFTGGNVIEKPERLKDVLKSGNIVSDIELIRNLELLLDWNFNQQPYNGPVLGDQGKPRMQVYNEQLHTKRQPHNEDDLNLMLMRSSRAQMVGERGVHLSIAGIKLDYWTPELVATMSRQKVYYRYDPENLSSVRVYNLQDQFLMVVPVDSEAICEYGCSQDELEVAAKKVSRAKKIVKESLAVAVLPSYDKISALDLAIEAARRQRGAYIPPATSAKVIQLQHIVEEPLLQKVSGLDYDIDTMLKNAEKYNNGGHIYEQNL